MPGRVSGVGTQEAPGSVVVAEEAVRVLAFAADAFVGDADRELAAPLHLPVMAEATQRFSAQDLGVGTLAKMYPTLLVIETPTM